MGKLSGWIILSWVLICTTWQFWQPDYLVIGNIHNIHTYTFMFNELARDSEK